MSISFLTPWRDDGQRGTVKNWLAVRWQKNWPTAEFIVSDDDGGTPFSKAVALNNAAGQASGDILIVLDADVWLPVKDLRAGLEAAADGEWVMPANEVWRLNQAATRRLLSRAPTGRWPIFDSADIEAGTLLVGSVQIVPRVAWERVGGFDPRFRGWGG